MLHHKRYKTDSSLLFYYSKDRESANSIFWSSHSVFLHRYRELPHRMLSYRAVCRICNKACRGCLMKCRGWRREYRGCLREYRGWRSGFEALIATIPQYVLQLEYVIGAVLKRFTPCYFRFSRLTLVSQLYLPMLFAEFAFNMGHDAYIFGLLSHVIFKISF